MSELETNAEAEVEEFNDELSDEALDRDVVGRFCCAFTAGGFSTCAN
jgi:hypothetical protein